MEQYVKGFKGFTPVEMCGLSPLASFYFISQSTISQSTVSFRFASQSTVSRENLEKSVCIALGRVQYDTKTSQDYRSMIYCSC